MDPFIGEIILFAGNFEPRNWKTCDGQIIQIRENEALFSILGTTYGGDGQTTFGLPKIPPPTQTGASGGGPRYLICFWGTYPARN